jgi:hypothetical protein
MMNRTTSFVVGALTCTIAGASFVTMHLGDAGAAAECLATPSKGAPAGQHWYYRIDRATQRHCWYLGDEGKAVARAAKATPERRTTLTESDRGAALARSAANTRAEMPMPQASGADDAKAAPVAPAISDSGTAAQGAPRDAASEPAKSPDIWRALDAANFQAAASEAPKSSSSVSSAAASSMVASATTDAAPGTKNEPDTAAATPPEPVSAPAFTPPAAAIIPPVTAARMEAPGMGRATSLSALFLAAFGALVFVTLAAGLAYFFTDRTQDRRPEGASLGEDWPPEPFRLPSSLRLLAHGSFVDESVPAPSQAFRVDVPRASAPANASRDSDVRQIEQLLTRAVRRSESLRGQIDGLTS